MMQGNMLCMSHNNQVHGRIVGFIAIFVVDYFIVGIALTEKTQIICSATRTC